MKIKFAAVAKGTGAFVALYAIHLLLLPVLQQTAEQGEGGALIFGLHQLLGILTCLIAGYVAAKSAGEHGFFYGLGVGALGTLLTALAALVWSIVTGARFQGAVMLPFWVLVNGFIAAVAGFTALSDRKNGEPPADGRLF